jgi:starch synthase (maltosyl-transferring)
MVKKGDKKETVVADTNQRVVIENVTPEINCGRFPIKRVVGERVVVEADLYADGHDALRATLLWRHEGDERWEGTPFEPLVNDRWRSEFVVGKLGRYRYTVRSWVDRFETWRRTLAKKHEAGQAVGADVDVGVQMMRETLKGAREDGAAVLESFIGQLEAAGPDLERRVALALDGELATLMADYPDLESASVYGRELEVVVDPERAVFSTWYEMFPRSCAHQPGAHGTFRDCLERLPYIAEMGFDVLYLPPIHPIGETNRRGANNRPDCDPDDVGSPWAIGSKAGGHKAIHPQLGTLEDFRELVRKAREMGMEVALDIAFQCSPDHPYVEQHPEWFLWRPDGTIQYAENPPKKYQDIYPLNFDTNGRVELWRELKSIFEYWIEQGVRTFRVDNPHTKPFRFWEWLIGDIKNSHPDVVFLSEAFTRPKVMYRLAKLGFDQSYTYFAWRNAKWELEQYMEELTQTEVNEYFRPNFWPNTPDILTEYLQAGGRGAFAVRVALAATLAASYGIYGPAFELCENTPRAPGSEEYADSEKYQLRHWDVSRPDSLGEIIARLNRIRRDVPALRRNNNLEFHYVDNDNIICYSKRNDEKSQIVVVVVNLDPHHTQSGWVSLPLEGFGLDEGRPFQMHDLFGGGRYMWNGPHNYVELDPRILPAHVFMVRRYVRSEQDFEYFL